MAKTFVSQRFKWLVYGCMIAVFGTTISYPKTAVYFLIAYGLGTLGYTTLPVGMKNSYKIQLMLLPSHIFNLIDDFAWFVGYGTITRFMPMFQTPIITKGPVASSKHGDVVASREFIEDVPVIIYKPKKSVNDNLSPCLIYIHGGGFCNLSADICDETVYQYCSRTNLMGVSINYRRAPQHPFPAPLDDCIAVVRHLLSKGSEYGVDSNNVCIMGESAGANLSASICLTLTRENETLGPHDPARLPPLKCQILHYPTLQIMNFRLPAYQDFCYFPSYASALHIIAYYCLYLGVEKNDISHYVKVMFENRHISKALRENSKLADYINLQRLPVPYQNPHNKLPVASENIDETVASRLEEVITDPRLSPLLADDLSGLPQTFIHITEFDCLRDDGFLFYSRLKEAGVDVELYFGINGFHCDTVRSLPNYLHPLSGEEAQEEACQYIRRIFDLPSISQKSS